MNGNSPACFSDYSCPFIPAPPEDFPPAAINVAPNKTGETRNMTNTAPMFEIYPNDSSETLGAVDNSIEKAVIALFEQLEKANALGIMEAAKKPALIKAARSLDSGLALPKASVATANMYKQFFEALETLPKLETGGNPEVDALDATLQELTAAAFTDEDTDQ